MIDYERQAVIPTVAAIRCQLAAYLDGTLPFEEFWDFLGCLKPLVAIGSSEQRLLYRIVGRLYEFDRGAWTDEQVIALLMEVADD